MKNKRALSDRRFVIRFASPFRALLDPDDHAEEFVVLVEVLRVEEGVEVHDGEGESQASVRTCIPIRL